MREMVKELTDVRVSSAGVVGWEGSPAVDEAVRAAADRGADISGHRARRLERRHVEDADLIVCMAAEHRDAVIRLAPDAEARTFGLKELARLLAELPSGTDSAPQDRVRGAHERRLSASSANERDEDVADPIGMSQDAFRDVAWDIDVWTGRLVAGLFGAPDHVRRQQAIEDAV